MEVINTLLDYKNLRIYQNSKWFKFSLDSVLLANFVTLNKGIKKIIDLGTGNAPIPLILSARTSSLIYGVEVQKEIFELALKTIKINKKETQIKLIYDNYKNIDKIFETDTFDIVVSNPPFFEYTDSSNVNDNKIKTIARHEIYAKLEDVFIVTKKILKNNGVLALVHRTERLVEILCLMKKHNIEPKRLRLVYPKRNKGSNIILIEGKKNGKKGLKILSPLYVHKRDGSYSKEVMDMFKE
ncbi:MAG: tRNA1(Val) (adenine(37)-N6)-methyltransferase [Bacilli bacterium]